MQAETKTYLDTLCGQIRWKEARHLVREEILGHIEENKKEGESKGMSKSEAEIKAARAMGDPIEVGKMMDKLHRPKTDILMVISTAVLMLFGIAVLTAARLSYNMGISLLVTLGPEWILLKVIGIALFIVCLFVNFRWLLKKNIFIISSGVIGIAGLLFLNLTSAQHRFWEISNEWLAFISYICICLVVISFAGLLLRLQKKSWATVIFAIGVILSAAAMLMLRENAPRIIAVFLLISMTVMVWFTNIKTLWKIVASVAIAAFVFIYLLKHGYLNHGYLDSFFPRLYGMSMMDDGETAVLKERLANVQVVGQAPGLTEIRFNTLHLASVNIMIYILLNFGILPAVILLCVLGVLIWRMISACIRIRDTQGRVLAAGLAAFIMIAVIGTLLLNLLFLGTSGTYMPLLQAGPEFVLYSVFAGLIAGLYRRKGLYADEDIVALNNSALTDTETV